MTKQILIEQTLNAISKLPQDKVNEIADFTDFISKKYEDEILQSGIQELVSNSKAFSYLENEENLYTVNDVKEKYK